MEVQFTSDKLEIPSNLSVGQQLNNGTATMTVSNKGVKIMNMIVSVQNRKVETQEKITVPAGTFDCFKITYDVESKILFKVSGKAVEWYVKGIGTIKQESFDSKGNKTGYLVLTNFKN